MHIKPDVVVFILVIVTAIVIGALAASNQNTSVEPDTATEESAALEDSSLEPGDIQRGQDIAQRLCGGCHALPPATVSPVPAAPLFTDVASRWPLDNLAEALAEGIMVSHGDHVQMPEFSFEPQEIEDLLAYLASIKL